MTGTSIPAENLLLSFAILVTGTSATKMNRALKHMGVACILLSTFFLSSTCKFFLLPQLLLPHIILVFCIFLYYSALYSYIVLHNKNIIANLVLGKTVSFIVSLLEEISGKDGRQSKGL